MKLHFTLDLEEWFDAENIKPYVDGQDSAHSSMYVVEQVLEFLERKGVRGTFFCLGKTAKENRDLIATIASHKHEIASHGWSHTLLDKLSRRETLRELADTKALLEDLSGSPVIGYRSPCFSQNEFIYQCLQETGHEYTSMQISASYHDRYKAGSHIDNPLVDFPLPVARIGGLSFPATGGGWFRLFPVFLQKRLIINANNDHAVFYCHPWDFDPNQPRLNAPMFVRFRHLANVKRSFSKLDELSFDPRSLGDVFNEQRSVGATRT